MRLILGVSANLLLLLCFLSLPHSAFSFQKADSNTQIADTLSQQYGFINFEVEPDTAYIYLDMDYSNVIKVFDGDSLKLSAGFHNLFVFAENIPERRISVEVESSKEQIISVRNTKAELTSENYSAYAAYRWGANLMILTDNETAISVVGTEYFSYGLMKAKLSPGAHKIRFERPSGKTYESFIEVNSYQMITLEEYFKPIKDTSIMAGFLPGASQFYKGEAVKGLSAIAFIGLATGLTIHYNTQLGNRESEFDVIRRNYDQANTESLALQLGNRLDDAGSELTAIRNRRNIFRITAFVLYVANFVDAFREPQNGFANKHGFNPFRDFSVQFDETAVEATVHIKF